ncbi:MAG: histone H1 [Chloroflexi bacterium]|nr:histone H1 [Chloroflexota bacterium]
MAKWSSKKKEHDFSVIAHRVVEEATGEESEVTPSEAPQDPTPEERHVAAVTPGRLGGKKGGEARAKKLTPEQRQEIARRAAQRRWGTP